MRFVPAKVTRVIARQILTTKKNSPHIFFVGGVIGIVASGVLACRSTLKLSDRLDEIQEDIKGVKALKEKTDEGYPIEEYPRDLGYAYGRASIELVKLYGPAILLGAASVAALTGSHIQLTRRNSALMAAYAAVAKAYNDYRERVREAYGVDRELDLYHGATTAIEKGEAGEKIEVKTVDPNTWSPYARFFDEGSSNWNKNPELNRLFVQCQQNYANNLLRARGHVFLNEVYDMLDLERSQAGAVVGWVIGEDGDNYIDFGIYKAFSSQFIGERNILLDFNVDGVIYDKI